MKKVSLIAISVVMISISVFANSSSVIVSGTVINSVNVEVVSNAATAPNLSGYIAPKATGSTSPNTTDNQGSGSTTVIIELDENNKVPKHSPMIKLFYQIPSKIMGYDIKYKALTNSKNATLPIQLVSKDKSCQSANVCMVKAELRIQPDIKVSPGLYQGSVSLVLLNS